MVGGEHLDVEAHGVAGQPAGDSSTGRQEALAGEVLELEGDGDQRRQASGSVMTSSTS